MKLNRYNFLINNEAPDSKSHMDFDALMNRVERNRPSLVRRLLPYVGGAIAASFTLFIIYQSSLQPDYEDQSQAWFDNQDYIKPPFSQDLLEAEKHDLSNAARSGSILLNENIKVSWPDNAFVDAQGKSVAGQIELQYRHYRDYVDFFLSGISMEYDSAGTSYEMASYGMVEVFGVQNGKRIFVSPGKEIELEFVTEIIVPEQLATHLPDYNVYFLNEGSRNWDYKGKDKLSWADDWKPEVAKDQNQALSQLQKNYSARIARLLKPKAPSMPERASSDAAVFDFNFLANDNPILKGIQEKYGDVLWKVIPARNPDFDQNAIGNIAWEGLEVKELDNEIYEVTLIAGTSRKALVVSPVLGANEYALALARYESEKAQYEKDLAEYEEQLASLRAELRKKEQDLQKAERMVQTDRTYQRKIRHAFTADAFGIWNCDQPKKMFTADVRASFVDADANELKENTAYLIDKQHNTIKRIYAIEGATVPFNPDSDHLLWMVNGQGTMSIATPESLTNLGSKEEHTFVLETIEQEIKSETQFRDLIDKN